MILPIIQVLMNYRLKNNETLATVREREREGGRERERLNNDTIITSQYYNNA